jgi:hypothetical protein
MSVFDNDPTLRQRTEALLNAVTALERDYDAREQERPTKRAKHAMGGSHMPAPRGGQRSAFHPEKMMPYRKKGNKRGRKTTPHV